jgi:phosphohistidine phosphatase
MKPISIQTLPKKVKTLHIVRHGKALQDYRAIGDIDRPLTEKGIRNSIAMAARLAGKYAVPDLIVSSPAARALHTAHIFARTWDYPPERVKVDGALYLDGEKTALEILLGLSGEISSVMIAGHNPDVSYLANMFIRPLINSLPTSGVATIRFDTPEWSGIYGTVAGFEIDCPELGGE